jgi:hypothetical protein
MLQCQTGMAGGAALLRLRLLYRMLRAGELLALVALVSWSSSYVPSAVAAALRLAGSLLLNARFVFVLGNAIVLLLFALSRHDLSPSSSSGDVQSSSTTTTAPPQAPASADDSSAGFVASFATPLNTATTTLTSSSDGAATTATLATPASAMEAVRVPALEENKQQQQPAAARTSKARAPRRSRSEKMGPRQRRAASPELRRCESENGGRRRRRSSATARDAEACCAWGRDDADEFRRQVEAFIARQTRFHREESMLITVAAAAAGHCEAAPAFTGALAVVE